MNVKTRLLFAVSLCAVFAGGLWFSGRPTVAQNYFLPQTLAPLFCYDSSGSGTAGTCTTSPSFTPTANTSQANMIIYETTTGNTGDMTITVNGAAAAHIRKNLGSLVLQSGDIPANVPTPMLWDGTYWEVLAGGNETGTVASGTAAMESGTAITSGTCATTVTVTATGVATTDIIIYTPNSNPQSIAQYAASATGSLYIWAYPTSGNVNFELCNNTGGSLTPASALTINWRVVR